MSNLEHLVENGIIVMEQLPASEWEECLLKDPNWEGVNSITIDDLWTICQYVVYTYKYNILDTIEEKIGNTLQCLR